MLTIGELTYFAFQAIISEINKSLFYEKIIKQLYSERTEQSNI